MHFTENDIIDIQRLHFDYFKNLLFDYFDGLSGSSRYNYLYLNDGPKVSDQYAGLLLKWCLTITKNRHLLPCETLKEVLKELNLEQICFIFNSEGLNLQNIIKVALMHVIQENYDRLSKEPFDFIGTIDSNDCQMVKKKHIRFLKCQLIKFNNSFNPLYTTKGKS